MYTVLSPTATSMRDILKMDGLMGQVLSRGVLVKATMGNG